MQGARRAAYLGVDHPLGVGLCVAQLGGVERHGLGDLILSPAGEGRGGEGGGRAWLRGLQPQPCAAPCTPRWVAPRCWHRGMRGVRVRLGPP
jgi:hypothetical protein